MRSRLVMAEMAREARKGGGVGGVVHIHFAAVTDFAGDVGAFEGPDALLAPPAGDHFLDEGAFDGGAGAEGVVKFSEELLETGLVLAGNDEALGEDGVADGIEGGIVLAGGGDGAARFGAIGARGGGAKRGDWGFRFHAA